MSDASPPPSRNRCLTEAEIAAVQAAPPGAAPEELARHLAGCERCQERALFGAGPRRRLTGRARPDMPTPTRALFLVALMVAAMAAFFYTLHLLAGR
jgi:hypothetical protein